MAHVRQSRPDSGLGFKVKVLKTLHVVASPLGTGMGASTDGALIELPCHAFLKVQIQNPDVASDTNI